MAYQILALDLDGTLTNSQKEITKPTLDALIEICLLYTSPSPRDA